MSGTTEPKTSICIVGVGALTSVGLTAPSAAAAVRAGIPGFGEHPFMIDRQGEPMIVACVPSLDAKMSVGDRLITLAAQATKEALSSLSPHHDQIGSVPLFLGLPPKRPGRPENLENAVSDCLRREAGVSATDCIATGHAAGLMALEAACRKITNHSAAFCLVGGVDSYIEPDTLEWIEANDQLHCGPNAYGFIPGEAAGFCLICSHPVAEKWKLRVLARVWTVGTARETILIKTDSVCVGKGLTEAFRKVFDELPSPRDKIDHSINDMNGEPYRADEYGFAVARLSGRFENAPDFLAPADCWGDVGAASGPLFLNLVVAASQRGYADARHNLIWTSSESGERAAAILQHETAAKN